MTERVLAEAEARVEPDACPMNAGRLCSRGLHQELALHVHDHVVVVRRVLHRARLAPHVVDDQQRVMLRTDAREPRIPETRHRIDDGRAALQSLVGNPGAARIDRDR